MHLGTYLKSEPATILEVERAVRIRILHDVRKALMDSVGIRMQSENLVNFQVKYERIPMFCYGCGVLGHGDNDCEDGPFDDGELRFGEELRVLPWKSSRIKMKARGSGGRNLADEFEREFKQRDEEAVMNLIEKLQKVVIKRQGQGIREMNKENVDGGSTEGIIHPVESSKKADDRTKYQKVEEGTGEGIGQNKKHDMMWEGSGEGSKEGDTIEENTMKRLLMQGKWTRRGIVPNLDSQSYTDNISRGGEEISIGVVYEKRNRETGEKGENVVRKKSKSTMGVTSPEVDPAGHYDYFEP